MEKTIIEGGEQPVKTEEKYKEIAMLKDALKSRDILQEEDRQEIERLKALIKTAYYAGVADEQSDEGTFNDFELQNNLKKMTTENNKKESEVSVPPHDPVKCGCENHASWCPLNPDATEVPENEKWVKRQWRPMVSKEWIDGKPYADYDGDIETRVIMKQNKLASSTPLSGKRKIKSKEAKDYIHLGIEFSQREQFKDSGASYISGVGLGYSCGYQDGEKGASQFTASKPDDMPEFQQGINSMSQKSIDKVDGLLRRENFEDKTKNVWNTCMGEAIRKAKLSVTILDRDQAELIINQLEDLKL